MQLCAFYLPSRMIGAGILDGDRITVFKSPQGGESPSLSSVLYSSNPTEAARRLASTETVSLDQVTLLPPLDKQEVWAAGVTYKRSREARERESQGAARFYDLVYNAERPELFFKSPAWRVVGPDGPVRIRKDARWSVPEPELALVISPAGAIVGYTIGNDMSSRDIEGENPLYLPQAKVYDGSCAIGPVVTLADALPALEKVQIRLSIDRDGKTLFEGSTSLDAMKRTLPDLVSWLMREIAFPDGVLLLTGTGIVPPDDFTLAVGDRIAIDITGIGRLTNIVQ
jgi:2-dehydro-3-deoxy-D-arabinonate dehydratase